MRIPGYCAVCHRFRTVYVRIPNLRGVSIGVCASCEDKQRKDKEDRQ